MADPTPVPAASAPPAKPEPKSAITFADFAKVDLRIARILACEAHPNPGVDRIWKLQVDDGSGTPRQILAGVRKYYTPEQLVGKSIVIVANLEPKDIRGEQSRGMLLAASDAPKEGTPAAERRVVILTPLTEMPPGSIVS
jgi:methionine--tRNA ligase beta chain